MLPFTTMLAQLSLAPLAFARAYCEALSSTECLCLPAVDRCRGAKPPAAWCSCCSGSRVLPCQPSCSCRTISTQFFEDQVATVDYQILFTKRGNEFILESGRTIVAKAMTGSGFASWKIAQFIRRNPDLIKPPEWSDQEWGDITENNKLRDNYFEFLQVEYQVLSTLDRKSPADPKIAALLEIANAIKQK